MDADVRSYLSKRIKISVIFQCPIKEEFSQKFAPTIIDV